MQLDVDDWWIYGTYNIILHGIVLILSLPILFFKWRAEYPRRALNVWMMDVSKQIIGYIVLNLIPAYYLISNDEITANYWLILFMGTLLDGLIVTAFSYLFLITWQNAFNNWAGLKYVSGIYPNGMKSLAYQLVLWLFMIMLSKFIVLAMIYFLEQPLFFSMYFLLYLLRWNKTFEFIVIMLVVPLFINIVVLAIQVGKNVTKFRTTF